MQNESGALEFARRAKRLESPDSSEPGHVAFKLIFRTLPGKYLQWLLGVDKSAETLFSSVWMWTENARKALAARQRCESLTRKIACIQKDGIKVNLLRELNTIDTFLASAYIAFVLVEGAIFKAIFSVHILSSSLLYDPSPRRSMHYLKIFSQYFP